MFSSNLHEIILINTRCKICTRNMCRYWLEHNQRNNAAITELRLNDVMYIYISYGSSAASFNKMKTVEAVSDALVYQHSNSPII